MTEYTKPIHIILVCIPPIMYNLSPTYCVLMLYAFSRISQSGTEDRCSKYWFTNMCAVDARIVLQGLLKMFFVKLEPCRALLVKFFAEFAEFFS